MNTPLHTNTPLSKAIFRLLGELENLIVEKHKALPAGAVKVYIFGGCAVHIFTNARGSNDLDAEFEGADLLQLNELFLELDDEYFTDEEGESSLHIDDNFNTGLTPLTDNYQEDAIPLHVDNSVLHIYLISAVDIAVSKLSRASTDDIKDIISLYKAGRFTIEEFKDAANTALDYYATPSSLKPNIDYAINKLQDQ